MGIFYKDKPKTKQMLSENFSLEEMACRCGCGFMPDVEFLRQLQALRDRFGKSMPVSSGARCHKHNQREGGSMNSYHKLGRAADIRVPDGVTRYKLVAMAIGMGFNGVGVYEWGVHIDNRDKPEMWV